MTIPLGIVLIVSLQVLNSVKPIFFYYYINRKDMKCHESKISFFEYVRWEKAKKGCYIRRNNLGFPSQYFMFPFLTCTHKHSCQNNRAASIKQQPVETRLMHDTQYCSVPSNNTNCMIHNTLCALQPWMHSLPRGGWMHSSGRSVRTYLTRCQSWSPTINCYVLKSRASVPINCNVLKSRASVTINYFLTIYCI